MNWASSLNCLSDVCVDIFCLIQAATFFIIEPSVPCAFLSSGQPCCGNNTTSISRRAYVTYQMLMRYRITLPASREHVLKHLFWCMINLMTHSAQPSTEVHSEVSSCVSVRPVWARRTETLTASGCVSEWLSLNRKYHCIHFAKKKCTCSREGHLSSSNGSLLRAEKREKKHLLSAWPPAQYHTYLTSDLIISVFRSWVMKYKRHRCIVLIINTIIYFYRPLRISGVIFFSVFVSAIIFLLWVRPLLLSVYSCLCLRLRLRLISLTRLLLSPVIWCPSDHVMCVWGAVCLCAGSVWMPADHGFASGFFTAWSYWRSPSLLLSPQSESHTDPQTHTLQLHCYQGAKMEPNKAFLVFITVLIITIVEQNATIAEVVVYYVIQYIFTSNIIQMPYPGGLKR